MSKVRVPFFIETKHHTSEHWAEFDLADWDAMNEHDREAAVGERAQLALENDVATGWNLDNAEYIED